MSREDASHLKRWRRKARPKRSNFSMHMLPQPLQTWGEMPPWATFARARFTGKVRDCFRRIVLNLNLNFDFSKKEKNYKCSGIFLLTFLLTINSAMP